MILNITIRVSGIILVNSFQINMNSQMNLKIFRIVLQEIAHDERMVYFQ